MKSLLIIIITLLYCGPATSFIHTALINGLQMITQLIQNKNDPASLVFDNLQAMFKQESTPLKGEEGDNKKNPGIWRAIFQTLGLEYKKFPDYTINILLFIIQMINNKFVGKNEADTRTFTNKESLMELVLKQPQVSRLLSQMQDPGLMGNVLRETERQLSEDVSDCPIQLVCRSTPIVQGMQTSLAFFMKQKQHYHKHHQRGETETLQDNLKYDLEALTSQWKELTPLQRFFFFMPTLEDFTTTSQLCRKKYPKCEQL